MILENIKSVKKKKNEFTNDFNGYLITMKDDTQWHVPLKEGNRHHDAAVEWAAIDGNNIEEAD